MENTKNILFSAVFLSINDSPISIDEIKEVIPEGTYTYTVTENKRVHIFKYVYCENYHSPDTYINGDTINKPTTFRPRFWWYIIGMSISIIGILIVLIFNQTH